VAVWLHDREGERRNDGERAERAELAEPRAGDEVHRERDGDDDDRRTKVRLGDDEARHERRDEEKRKGHLPRTDAVAVSAEPRPEIQNECELRELGGLHADDGADAQPPGRAAGADADARHEHGDEQDDRDDEERDREDPQAVIVRPRGDDERCEPEDRPGGLLREVRARIIVGVERGDAARAVDHREAEQQQHQHDDDKRHVVGRRPREAQPHRSTVSRTISANRLPRSSADENMSNDAHAGERSATSPGRTSSRMAATASSSDAARRTAIRPSGSAAAIACAISSAARPISTAPRARRVSARASRLKSAPFEIPPRITTAGRSNAASAVSVAAGVVAAESFTQRTPSFSPTVSSRRGTPSNSRSTPAIACGSMSKTCGLCPSVSSWKLDSSRTTMSSGVRVSTSWMTACPMFPPTSTRRRPSDSTRSTSVVVVVFPFVPVTPTIGAGQRRKKSAI